MAGKLTGGTQRILSYTDGRGVTRFVVHEVTDGAGRVVHRDFDAVIMRNGLKFVK